MAFLPSQPLIEYYNEDEDEDKDLLYLYEVSTGYRVRQSILCLGSTLSYSIQITKIPLILTIVCSDSVSTGYDSSTFDGLLAETKIELTNETIITMTIERESHNHTHLS